MKKKLDKAVALAYSPDDAAPRVIAKGKGAIARNIVDKAEEEEIVIYEDRQLVENLIELDLNEEIPEDLYQVVAEIIFYVYSLDKEKARNL